MNNSDIDLGSSTNTKLQKKKGTSVVMKSFWGLIGLLALAAVGLIGMAVVALKEHTYVEKTVTKPGDESVEIIDLAGNSRIVNSGLAPANPTGEDESIVKTGTEDAVAAASQLQDNQKEGDKLVTAVKPITPSVVEKKAEVVVAAAKPVEKPAAKAEAAPKVEKSVQHKEANAQMDNLF